MYPESVSAWKRPTCQPPRAHTPGPVIYAPSRIQTALLCRIVHITRISRDGGATATPPRGRPARGTPPVIRELMNPTSSGGKSSFTSPSSTRGRCLRNNANECEITPCWPGCAPGPCPASIRRPGGPPPGHARNGASSPAERPPPLARRRFPARIAARVGISHPASGMSGYPGGDIGRNVSPGTDIWRGHFPASSGDTLPGVRA